MKRKIITDLNYLKQKSEEVSAEEVNNIVQDLRDSLDTTKGIGLSAIQIGIPKKVGLIKIGDKETILINPKIIEKEDKIRFKGESCLSLPGIHIDTLRYRQITLENNGNLCVSSGLEAVCISHEVDHMNGILILDRKWKKQK